MYLDHIYIGLKVKEAIDKVKIKIYHTKYKRRKHAPRKLCKEASAFLEIIQKELPFRQCLSQSLSIYFFFWPQGWYMIFLPNNGPESECIILM